MKDEKIEVLKLQKVQEILDGKKDFILRYPGGGKILVEESVYLREGFTYEQLIGSPLLVGALLAKVGLMVLAGGDA